MGGGGGGWPPPAEAGAPDGTTVGVRDLFLNVPARKKFLKRASTEQSHAVEAVLRLALPRPEVALVPRGGEPALLPVPAGAPAGERAAEAVGGEGRGKLLPLHAAVARLAPRRLPASPAV